MSRVGRKPIPIPQGVQVQIERQKVKVTGPKGEISREFRPEIKIELKEGKILLSPQQEIKDKEIKALWGLTRMLIANMVEGVVQGFEKKLEIEGVGFKAEVSGQEIVLSVGFSHQVRLEIPQGIKVSVEKNVISVSGIDKEAVGQFASNIKKVKPPEPYKGKGIKYAGEVVRRKAGKKVITTAGAK
ncbi:MAG: 50S ribosomal protein L6 [Candidatus Pacebacteria bacterium]|nr:50S ribosomal protein L6 [Candidatus Paceibacterota bacterium]